MEKRKFASPREEALELARKTRKDILDGKKAVVSILRSCLVIANNLNKKDAIKWINLELGGYPKSDEVPYYRNLSCFYEKEGVLKKKPKKVDIRFEIHVLTDFLARKEDLRLSRGKETILINAPRLNRILTKLIDECLFFLNDTINELQYGGTVEYLMEEIRKNTDERLTKLDKKLVDEARSLFLNLTSTNPADWNKVGHSSRKMLKIFADNVFPPQNEKYKMKDGREIEVGDPHYINRLCAFLDQKVKSKERKFLISQIEYFESYLRQVTKYAQMGEHKTSIEKYHANLLAIHTYLIISEILKHKD